MDGRICDGLDAVVDVACRRLAQGDVDAPPEAVPSGPGAARAVMAAVRSRIGGPLAYGGAVRGLCVRWAMDDRVLALSGPAGDLQLSVRPERYLDRTDRIPFDAASAPVDFEQLPYVWLILPGRPMWPPPPRVPIATSWSALETSLSAVLYSCMTQASHLLYSQTHFGFNITGGPRAVAAACDSQSLSVLVDDRGPSEPTPPEEMMRRGWDRPLVGWWEHTLLAPDQAAAAATMLVGELRAGDATPSALRADDVSSNGGTLLLPGLAVR
ncbi:MULTISPECIES: hypothetical protein [Streptomyces]|uniref:Uncharacterized protein n=1 Tax=Streptomyces ramulosus TaxID=47762 RepID=A0ABW1FXV1_9ACTN